MVIRTYILVGKGVGCYLMKDEKNMDLPLRLTLGMAMKENAMKNYSLMSESEQENVKNQAKSVKNKYEMEQLIDRIDKNEFI